VLSPSVSVQGVFFRYVALFQKLPPPRAVRTVLPKLASPILYQKPSFLVNLGSLFGSHDAHALTKWLFDWGDRNMRTLFLITLSLSFEGRLGGRGPGPGVRVNQHFLLFFIGDKCSMFWLGFDLSFLFTCLAVSVGRFCRYSMC